MMRRQMHEWCEREQYKAEDAQRRKQDDLETYVFMNWAVGVAIGFCIGMFVCDLMWRLCK